MRFLSARFHWFGVGVAACLLVAPGGCPAPETPPAPSIAQEPTAGDGQPTVVLGYSYAPASTSPDGEDPLFGAVDVSLAAITNRTVTVPLSAFALPDSVAEFEIVDAPPQGALGPITLSGPLSASVAYVPPADFIGSVSFTYRAIIDGAETSPGTIAIEILPEIRFGLSVRRGTSPLTVTMSAFTVQGAPLPDGVYTWQIGEFTEEGTVSTHSGRTHVFTRAGQFAIGLTVTIAALSQPIVCQSDPDNATLSMVIVDEPAVEIRGAVRSSGGAPLAGIMVVASDGLYSAQAAEDGTYVLGVPEGWSGSLAPASAAQFDPPSRSFSAVTSDVEGQDFTQVPVGPPPPGLLTITPPATLGAAGPLGGPFNPLTFQFTIQNVGSTPVNWTLTGASAWLSSSATAGSLNASAATSVLVSINDAADALPVGGYTQEITITNASGGGGDQTFVITLTVAPATLTISGRVATLGGVPVSGVTMGGLPGNPTTDPGGSYSATVPYGWSGTVTPSKAGCTFAPVNRTYDTVVANQPNQDFTATPAPLTISGRVTDSGGTGVSGVAMNGLPGTPTTDASGNYTATVDYYWSGTVTPAKVGNSFSPVTRSYVNVSVNRTGQNYTASSVTYVISGRVTDGGGAGLGDVTLEGLPGDPTTDPNGNYSGSVPAGWTGTITPSKAGYVFVPLARSFSNVSGHLSGQNFAASALSYTISGRVVDGSGIAIADVQLAGLPGDPTTDPNGYYSASVTHGWSGAATPTKTGFTFSPAGRTYTGVGGAQSAQDYVGTSAGGPTMASSVSQYGITWTFDKPYRVGQFVNGDWWVIPDAPAGTVSVVSVSPAPTTYDFTGTSTWGVESINGSMVNPLPWRAGAGNAQGWDSRITDFTASLRASFPLTLHANDSLVSAQSLTLDHLTNDEYYDIQGVEMTWDGRLKAAAVLTCLAAAPSPTAFRPCYSGTTKTLYDFSAVNLGNLPSLARPSGYMNTPTAESVLAMVSRLWLDCSENFVGRSLHPVDQMPNYGRELCGELGQIGIMICSDQMTSEQKRSAAIGLIQIGVDTAGVVAQIPDLFHVVAGQNVGRKFPLVFAAKMLDAPALIPANAVFSEDAAYFGDAESPPKQLWSGWQNSGHPYAANVMWAFKLGVDNGMNPTGQPVSWKHEHIHPNDWDQSPFPHNGNEYPGYRAASGIYGKHEAYRRICGQAMVGQTIAARILGLQTLWNHAAYFAYMDRWMYENEVTSGVDAAIEGAGWDPATHAPSQCIGWGRAPALSLAQKWYLAYRPQY